MKALIFFGMAAAAMTKCNKDSPEVLAPCVEQKIAGFGAQACENGANVKEYIFHEKTVYVFDPGTCGADMTSEVIDKGCTTIGYLGGFTGNTQIEGENFDKASYVRTVWGEEE